jgi:CrcB protein
VTAWIVVGLAGALGATSRHAADIGLRRYFPDGPSLGILVANILGSFVVGVIAGVSATRMINENLRLGVVVGFCGAFTTFSTFAAELAGLVNDRKHRMLVQWTAMMVLGGGLAAYAGIALGRTW